MILRVISICIFLTIGLLTFLGVDSYQGSKSIFFLFSISSNFMLLYSFRKNAIFFDTFLSIFLWLGFWFKIVMVLTIENGVYPESIGSFDFSVESYDNVLLIITICFITISLASFIRERYLFSYSKFLEDKSYIFLFYKKNRTLVIVLYILFFLFISISNYYLSIYQRGQFEQTVLPLGLNGVYKWLLLFGLSSISALLLRFEFTMKDKPIFIPILVLTEAVCTNLSLLSRGMVLNSSALGLSAMYLSYFKKKIFFWKYWLGMILFFLVFFTISIIGANELRKIKANENSNVTKYIEKKESDAPFKMEKKLEDVVNIFVVRGVGMEGFLAIYSSPQKGWDTFKDALSEKYYTRKTSFYDQYINSGYKINENSKSRALSLPGFLAFFFYPGSILFLISVVFLIVIIASFLEIFAYKLSSNNPIFSALIGEVIAYRLIHFGYVPAQSYLLFGAIILNILLIYGINKSLELYYIRKKIV